MKRGISDQTYEVLQHLRDSKSSLLFLFGRRTDFSARLEQVRQAAEPAAALHLLPLLVSRDRDLTVRVGRVISELVNLVPWVELPWLDEFARHGWSHYADDGWHAITPRDIARISNSVNDCAVCLGVASLHPDGFVRQAALEQLCRSNKHEALPFLLIRLNDWVENVRRLAHSCVESRLRSEFAPSFVLALPLVLRLKSAKRADHQLLLDQITRLLKTETGLAALETSLPAADPVVRRFSYRLMGEASHDLPKLIVQALEDPDPIVRRWGVEQIGRVADPEIRHALFDRALSDPVGGIRADVLTTFAEAFPADAHERMYRALLDQAASVRSIAQRWFTRTPDFQLSEFYRKHLHSTDSSQLRAAISGLGEMGDDSDIASVLPFLNDRRVGVRHSAVHAIGRHARTGYTEHLVAAVFDPAPGVSRRATLALVPVIGLVDMPRLWAQMLESRPFHVRRNILTLVNHLPKWDRISLLLQATRDSDPQIAALAIRHVRRWIAHFNRSFLIPSAGQIGRIREVLGQHRFALDRSAFRELEFCLRGFDL